MAFNIEQMFNTAIEESLSTEAVAVPQGEYPAVVQKAELRPVARKDGSEALTLVLTWATSDPAATSVTGRDPSLVRQQLWLDLTDEGNLDTSKGSNVSLGRLREAVGQNKPGKPWSMAALIGGYGKILVSHRTTEDGRTFAEVKSVRAA